MSESRWSSRFSELSQRLNIYGDNKELRKQDSKDKYKIFMSIFKDACAIVREAEAAEEPEIENIVEQAHVVLNKATGVAYGSYDIFDFIPSFAHSEASPLVEDKMNKGASGLGAGTMDVFIPFLRKMIKQSPSRPTGPEIEADLPKGPEPWNESMKPHTSSTPLARFRDGLPPLTASESTPVANMIYQARCEVTSKETCLSIHLALSSGNTCLAVPAMGGFKNRSPMLSYYNLSDDSGWPEEHDVNVGLADIAYHVTTDESRKLIFAADSSRIKSFSWDRDCIPVHTLKSWSHSGPLAMLSNGRLIRAGKGSAAVWNLNELQTHGPQGEKRIGKKENIEDTWRDDPEDIELSTGSPHSSVIQFAGNKVAFEPSVWRALPSDPATMLMGAAREAEDCSCFSLNLEQGGKTVARYLGHGGWITDFSTSQVDPNVFLTACSDGCARLFDLRKPLPVMTFDVGFLSEFCQAALLVHPDGIPTIFTGSDKKEQIKVWDVRARTIVYDLATGNNAVTSLAWDSQRSVLWAATECNYMDRFGSHYDYRPAKIPKKKQEKAEPAPEHEDVDMSEEEEEDDDNDNDDSDDYDYDGFCWPKRAHHSEDYFGYTFDAGHHALFRYAFKADADTSVVPAYGHATLESDMW